jgi:lysophospholipase L1-like esterase
MFVSWKRLIPLVPTLLALVGLSPTVAGADFNPPRHYYLALGDSVAFGAQLAKFFNELATGTYDPASFNTGYVDEFGERIRSIAPGVQTVNLSCPGESTDSFTTVCPFKAFGLPLHTNYGGSQESAAIAFLRAHPGQVSPITIDIGLNDAAFPCASPQFLVDVACFRKTMPAALLSVGHNLPQILADLHRASPSSEIIVMTYYNPFYVQDTSTDALIASLNREIAGIASRADVRIADAFEPFNRTGDETTRLCHLTLMCPGLDLHPSDRGYALIARQFWAASGYGESDH